MSANRSMKLFKEKRIFFPDPKQDYFEGIVAVDIPMTLETLFEAYSFGIFPWPHDDFPLMWFCPDRRGILQFKNLHISKKLKKFIANHNYHLSIGQDFEQVIRNCAIAERKGEKGTWITEDIIQNYCAFHRAGYAQSVECWNPKGDLVGGVYGVFVGGVFSGESMFFKEDNCSKLCLIHLIDFLSKNGIEWMDTQMTSSVIKDLGGNEIAKKEFLEKLSQSHKRASAIYFQES